jgi:hypothetical protein
LKCYNDKIKKTAPLVNDIDNDNDQETYEYVTNGNTKLSSYMKRKRKEPKVVTKFSWQQLKAPTSVINGTLAGNHYHHYHHYNHYHRYHHHYHRYHHYHHIIIIIVGDYGFDPLGIADTYTYLDRMREIELKHSRLAMLAAIGWPSSEIFHNNLMKLFELPFEMGNNGMALTVLNGVLLHGPNSIALGLFFLIISGLEYLAFNYRRQLKEKFKNKKKRLEPGDFGFDPLNLYEIKGSSPKAKKHMRLMEINNGRISMMAILIFTIEEFITNEPVTKVTPIFFTPFWETLGITSNSLH